MPAITEVIPSAFGDGTHVTVYGTDFGENGAVTIGGVEQTVLSWSSTSITFAAVRGNQSMGPAIISVVPQSVQGGALAASLTAVGWGQEITSGGTITGPAPLPVHFDAIATTHTTASIDTFRQVGYHFDFGYATPELPGIWPYSGKPKGNQIGAPIAAHLYETPGVYTASVRAKDANGVVSDQFVSIIVQDPNVVYAGTNTVCVSLAADFAGAPAGAQLLTAAPASLTSDKRYLFRAGEDFGTTTITVSHSTARVRVGSYGAGNRPKLKLRFPTAPPNSVQTMLASLVVDGCSLDYIDLNYGAYIAFVNCTTWRVITSAGEYPVIIGANVQYYSGNVNSKWPLFPALFNCEIDAQQVSTYCCFVRGLRLSVVGCYLHDTHNHTLRSGFNFKGFYAHTRFGALTNPTRAQIKQHAEGDMEPTDSANTAITPRSKYIVAADNLIDAEDANWEFAFCPQNAQVVELVQDVVAERNTFGSVPAGIYAQKAIVMSGNRLCARDNVVAPRNVSTPYGSGAHAAGLPPAYQSPYYFPAGDPNINGITDFANDATITPDKAGGLSVTVSGWGQEVGSGGVLTGPAPLAVFCDATATTHPTVEPFREMGYHFDFGYATPTTPGTWPYSGKPKGNQVGGPVAAHVYETPGTYTLSVRAQDPSGNKQDTSLTVVVQDPETYWTTGGRSTVTLTRAGTTAWPVWANNTRYLLEAGQDYSALGVLSIRDAQNVLVTRTGAGAAPVLSAARVAYVTGSASAVPPLAARVVFSGIASLGELSARSGGTDCLFHACASKQESVGTLVYACYAANPTVPWPRPKRIVFWGCDFDGQDAEMPFVQQSYQFVMVGCTSTNPVEHSLRIQGAQYSFVAHNWLHNQGQGAGAKHALTLRGDGLQDTAAALSSPDTLFPASRYVVMADNLLSDGSETATSSWPLYIGPQSTGHLESLEFVIAERTIYTPIAGGWEGQPVHGAFRLCRQVTIRDDIYLDPNVTAGTGSGGTGGANPPEWIGPFYSNTYISPPNNVTSFATPTGILPAKAGT